MLKPQPYVKAPGPPTAVPREGDALQQVSQWPLQRMQEKLWTSHPRWKARQVRCCAPTLQPWRAIQKGQSVLYAVPSPPLPRLLAWNSWASHTVAFTCAVAEAGVWLRGSWEPDLIYHPEQEQFSEIKNKQNLVWFLKNTLQCWEWSRGTRKANAARETSCH